jgi:hypothetical protein
MKNKLALLTGFLFCATIVYSQQKERKFLAELSLGPSFPLGKFAQKTYDGKDVNYPGFAKTGFNGQLSIGYHLNETFGVLLAGGYSIHAQDEKAYESQIKSENDQVARADVNAKSWKIAKVMAGGFFVSSLSDDDRLVLQTRITAGVCKSAIPEFSVVDYGSSGVWTASGKTGKVALPWTFCYQVSVGLKYKLNNKLHLLFDINSFNATAQKEYFSFINVPETATFGSGPVDMTSQSNYKKKFKLAEVNALAGIGIDF